MLTLPGHWVQGLISPILVTFASRTIDTEIVRKRISPGFTLALSIGLQDKCKNSMQA